MRRPAFLANITRAPSLKWTCRKLVGLALRRVRGIEREPVKEPVQPATERELAHTYLLLGFTAGAGAMALGFAFVLTFPGRFLCN